MPATDKVFGGAIPEIYDTDLVPTIFEVFAADLAGRVASERPGDVLETAAGSGVVTRTLAPRLPSGTRYVVTDLNQPMLDRAARMQPDPTTLVWQQADALALPFETRSFDAVCCQFGVMFFPDRVAGYAEALRVLCPGGQFVFNTWDRLDVNEFAHSVTMAAAACFPDDPPEFLARTPHGYHDPAGIGAEVRAAGFTRISVHTIAERSRAPTARHPAVAYAQGTPLRSEIEARDPARLEEVTDRAAAMIAARFGDGPVDARILGHVIVARA